MRKVLIGARLRYAFDQSMSKGTPSLLGWLFFISLCGVAIITLTIWTSGYASQPTLLDQFWSYSVTTIAYWDPTKGIPWPSRIAHVAVLMIAIFGMGSLLAVGAHGLDKKITSLRRGRSQVFEKGHTVILGWSDEIFQIIAELAATASKRGGLCVVVLADRDKVEMDDEIRERLRKLRYTRVITRRGAPGDIYDLNIASLSQSDAIIVLSPQGAHPDASILQALLAILKQPVHRDEPYHIIAELTEHKSVDIIRQVGKRKVEPIFGAGLIAQLIAQTSRQPALLSFYADLLDSGRDMVFAKVEPSLVGQTFGTLLMAYEAASVIGLLGADGELTLNPPMDTRILTGDQVVMIAKDEASIRLGTPRTRDADRISATRVPNLPALEMQADTSQTAVDDEPAADASVVASAAEHALILGWNKQGGYILHELAEYATPGLSIQVLTDPDSIDESEVYRLEQGLPNATIKFSLGDTTVPDVLAEIDFAHVGYVILLAYSDLLARQEADARTMMTLVHLENIRNRHGYPFTITSEIVNMRNRKLAAAVANGNFITKDRVVGKVIARVAKNKLLAPVLQDLLSPYASQIQIKPAAAYVTLGKATNFYAVVTAARQRGETAVGYCSYAADDHRATFRHLVINPSKSAEITFTHRACILVLASVDVSWRTPNSPHSEHATHRLPKGTTQWQTMPNSINEPSITTSLSPET